MSCSYVLQLFWSAFLCSNIGFTYGMFEKRQHRYMSLTTGLCQGADLSHVICSPTAANSIKSYSPDLIVHPILGEDRFVIFSLPRSDSPFTVHIQTQRSCQRGIRKFATSSSCSSHWSRPRPRKLHARIRSISD